MPYCLFECSPFAEEKNKEKIKESENSTDTIQGRGKKEDGSLSFFTVHGCHFLHGAFLTQLSQSCPATSHHLGRKPLIWQIGTWYLGIYGA